MRAAALLAALALLPLGAAACGGGDDGAGEGSTTAATSAPASTAAPTTAPTAPATTTSGAPYATEAARVCDDTRQAFEGYREPRTADDVAGYLTSMADQLGLRRERLGALRPPAGSEAAAQLLIDSVGGQEALVRQAADAVDDSGADPVDTLTTLRAALPPLQARVASAARTLGVSGCDQGAIAALPPLPSG